MLAALLLSALLDVPYLAQPPELCGGAAVAMTMRYWGARDIFPQDFSPVVSAADGGIVTTALVSDVRSRGWQALVLPITDDGRVTIDDALARGRPLIALIEVAPRTYHYVVIVGATPEAIVIHDPARAPYRVMPWASFDRAWAAARRWTLLLLPPADFARTSVAPSTTVAATAATTCTPLVERGVQSALDGDVAGAEATLTAARRLCPRDPAPLHELAGLRFSQSRWREAERVALDAVALDASDAYAWQLIATSRLLDDDQMGALDAWNRVGEPRLDLITIRGLTHMPQPVAVRASGLTPRALLTANALTRAERRLAAVPSLAAASARVEPLADARASVTIDVSERPLAPTQWRPLAIIGAHALIDQSVTVDVAGALRAGDRVRGAWRWTPERPRAEFAIALPAPMPLAGVIALDAFWEKQSYRAAIVNTSPGGIEANGTQIDARHRATLSLADWAPRGTWHWRAGIALDTFDARAHGAVDAALTWRPRSDRLLVRGVGGWWTPLHEGARFAAASLTAAARDRGDSIVPRWSLATTWSRVTQAAPRAVWPGAGTGPARDMLLRAHPLLVDEVLAGPVFGRALISATAEFTTPLPGRLGRFVTPAAFVDSARAWQRMDVGASPLYIDAGVGIRLRVPGQRGWIRLDVAHGLRGGGTRWSAGIVQRWSQ